MRRKRGDWLIIAPELSLVLMMIADMEQGRG